MLPKCCPSILFSGNIFFEIFDFLSNKKADEYRIHRLLSSAPVEIRTPNLLIRSQMLYPIELRVQGSVSLLGCFL